MECQGKWWNNYCVLRPSVALDTSFVIWRGPSWPRPYIAFYCFKFNRLQSSGHYMYPQFNIQNSTFSPHSVFMCFVWIWGQTAIISLYNINWLVFITETECVYCAVRSTFYVLPIQCFYVFYVDLRTNSDYFTVQHWLLGFYNWNGVCLLRGTFYILRSAHTVYLCVLCGSENKQRLFHGTALTDWLAFVTEKGCVYCAVRTGSLNEINIIFSSKSVS